MCSQNVWINWGLGCVSCCVLYFGLCVRSTHIFSALYSLSWKEEKKARNRKRERAELWFIQLLFSLSLAVNVLPLNGSFIASFTLLQKPFFFIIIYDGVFFLALSGNKNIY